jgi:universal stress protein F
MKRILVALDGSSRAESVFRQALILARVASADLYLFHAVGLPAHLPQDAYRSSPNDLAEQLRADATRELEARAVTVEPGITTHIVVRIASPWSGICEAAREFDVDLIVLGSHGYGAIDHVLGTTAAKVVNHVDRSVFVVRERARA